MNIHPGNFTSMLSSLGPQLAPGDPFAEEALVSFLLAHPDQAEHLVGKLDPQDFQAERLPAPPGCWPLNSTG